MSCTREILFVVQCSMLLSCAVKLSVLDQLKILQRVGVLRATSQMTWLMFNFVVIMNTSLAFANGVYTCYADNLS